MKNNLKVIREAKKITQSEVAERAGIPFRTYQDYELGLRVPNVYSAIKISEVLKTSIVELFPINT